MHIEDDYYDSTQAEEDRAIAAEADDEYLAWQHEIEQREILKDHELALAINACPGFVEVLNASAQNTRHERELGEYLLQIIAECIDANQ